MPSKAHELGHAGETAAAVFMQSLDFEVLYTSYRHKRAEVDLVVRRGQELLVFVEVKARSSSQFGYPETFVTERKKQLFRLAAEQLQEQLNWRGDIRFDILAVTPTADGLRIEHFEDAFY
jgi:putative endonuclease